MQLYRKMVYIVGTLFKVTERCRLFPSAKYENLDHGARSTLRHITRRDSSCRIESTRYPPPPIAQQFSFKTHWSRSDPRRSKPFSTAQPRETLDPPSVDQELSGAIQSHETCSLTSHTLAARTGAGQLDARRQASQGPRMGNTTRTPSRIRGLTGNRATRIGALDHV